MNRRIVVGLILAWIGVAALHAQDFEHAFQQAQEAFELRSANAQQSLKAYLADYPYTPYIDEVYTMQGILLTEQKQYKPAVQTMAKVDVKQLSRKMIPLYNFHMGYAYFQLGEESKALTYLQRLKKKDNPYALQATYYTGCCYYNQREYGKALVEFLTLEQNGGYQQIAPYYIVQIYYAQGAYDKVLERAEVLLADYPENEYNDELHRIAGEIYYRDSVYEKAVSHLKDYHQLRVEKKQEVLRNDLYLLGISNYRIQQYADAITYLKQVKQEADSISESSCLHLGHCYLRMNDIEKAKLAYAAAVQFDITPALREEAMYNYVQVTYLQNSALGESITAFQQFIKEYPQSKYIDKVYALMADMYVTSKNYQAALDALMEVQQPNAKVLETRQYLRYQLAVDAFVQDKMGDVKKWSGEVIAHEVGTSTYKTEAYYLSAQAEYRMRQYEACMAQLNLYEQQGNIAQSNNQVAALYLKAYAAFNLKDFATAESLYRRYAQQVTSCESTYADAHNRIGDCLFQARRFQEAIDTYQQVVKCNKIGVDYALLQQGFALGLLHRYPEKIEVLRDLTKEYPQSDYVDDALYEIARAELQQNRPQEAISVYQALLQDHPTSNYAAKTSLELGMAYRTLKQYDNAIQTFKNTIEQYPGSEEAYSALDGMEQIYVETNHVEEYIAYTKTIARMNMQLASSEDSLMYVTAELQYLMGNYPQAAAGLSTYLARFCPNGRYCTIATYYAANSYYQLKQYDNAIEQYSLLADMNGNPYMEEACMRVAELSYDKAEYRTAYYYFQQMSQVASSSAKRITAQLGMLRCSQNMADTTSVIAVASKLLEEQQIDSVTRNEALYCRAKAYWQGEQYGLALVDLTPIAKEVRTQQGAEAKYLLAACYYHLGAIDMAEQEIMSFTQMRTSHQYWLAKSLILLSDINVDRQELFQAKQYLLALQNNYHAQDDIQKAIESKLQRIAQLEVQQTTDTTQIQQL